jgi:uncharacterized protein DUF5372
LGFVTITHPHHPLCGQHVQIIRIRRGVDPDLVIRLPDGAHAAIAMSGTDYASLPAIEDASGSSPLLALDGLWQAAQFIAHLRHDAVAEGHAEGEQSIRCPQSYQEASP